MATKGKRVLLGCGLGCGLLLLMGVGSCIGFTAWLNRPGELIEPTHLMAAGTTGYMEWTLDGQILTVVTDKVRHAPLNYTAR